MKDTFGAACIVLVVLLAAWLTGCAGRDVRDDFNTHSVLYAAAVKVATVQVLEKNPAFAPQVAEIARAAAAELSGGDTVPLSALEAFVRGRIPWPKLKPEEVVLVDALISTVRQELENATRDVQAPEDVRVIVAQVLGWVAETAALFEAPVTPGYTEG